MSKAYALQNQLGQYATRKGEWVSGRDASVVAHFLHFDQALNQLFELGIKDIYLRGRISEQVLNEAGKLVISEIGPEPVQEPAVLTSVMRETAQSAPEGEAVC